MKRVETKLFKRTDVKSLLSLSECIGVIERAFNAYANGKIIKANLLHSSADEGEFHIKVGGLKLSKTYYGVKCNGGFFHNNVKHDLPNIQGLILLYDGDTGSPLAVFESGEITIKRTGAITAIATKYLSLPNADTATICGCGTQGRIQLKSLMLVRDIKKAFAYDTNEDVMFKFTEEMKNELDICIEPEKDLKKAIFESQICIACTPSKKFYIEKEYVHKGLFIAAVGADSPDKQEIDEQLMAENKVVADILEQCAEVGDLHHAIEKGLMKDDGIYAEIGDIISGKKPGRVSKGEIIIFDATGTALQDVASAAYVYEKSLNADIGIKFYFQE